MGYNYEIHFKPTAQYANADALSQLPLMGVTDEDVDIFEVEEDCFDIDDLAISKFVQQEVQRSCWEG